MLSDLEAQKIVSDVKSYLLSGKVPSPFWIKESFVKSLVHEFPHLLPSEQIERVQIIDAAIQAVKDKLVDLSDKQRKIVQERIAQFKIKMSRVSSGWKNKLLNISMQNIEKAHWQSVTFDSDATHPIETTHPSRFHSSQHNSAYSQLLQGTSFLSNRQALTGTKTMHVLDAAYSAYLLAADGKPVAALLAMGDGCGGHFGDEIQDKAISRTAYFSSKQALRMLASAATPEQCLQMIPQLIESLKQEVQIKTNHKQEGTTLLAVRTFPTENGANRLIGFNLGDSLLASYNFSSNQLETLAAAHVQILPLSHSEATANFPTSYQSEEIQIIDRELKPNTHLIAMSDGVYDCLPTMQQQGHYGNGAEYQATFLDHENLNEHLNGVENSAQLHQRLFDLAITRLETERQDKLSEAIQAKASLEQNQASFNQRFNEIRERQRQLEELPNSPENQAESEVLKKQQADVRREWEGLEAKLVLQLGDDVTLIGLAVPSEGAPVLREEVKAKQLFSGSK